MRDCAAPLRTFAQPIEVASTDESARVLRPQRSVADGRRLEVKRFAVVDLTEPLAHEREIVERQGKVGMGGAEDTPLDRDGTREGHDGQNGKDKEQGMGVGEEFGGRKHAGHEDQEPQHRVMADCWWAEARALLSSTSTSNRSVASGPRNAMNTTPRSSISSPRVIFLMCS